MISRRPADSFLAQWRAVDEGLLAHLAGRNAGIQDEGGADDVMADSEFLGSATGWRHDPLAAHTGGMPLAAFQGLKEGLRQIAL